MSNSLVEEQWKFPDPGPKALFWLPRPGLSNHLETGQVNSFPPIYRSTIRTNQPSTPVSFRVASNFPEVSRRT